MAITPGYTPMRQEVKRPKSMKSTVNTTQSPIENPSGCIENSMGVYQNFDGGVSKNPSGCIENLMGVDAQDGLSIEQFKNMDRERQRALVKHYWSDKVKDKDFDDGTFNFSVTTFKRLCVELGYEKVIIDTKHEQIVDKTDTRDNIVHNEAGIETITISRRKREDVTERKIKLSRDVIDTMNELLDAKLTNEEKSKIVESIIREAMQKKLEAKRAGQLSVEYDEKHEVKDVRNRLM